jgi:hypothetical protein
MRQFNITAMSYLDHLDFGIVADRDQSTTCGRRGTGSRRRSTR